MDKEIKSELNEILRDRVKTAVDKQRFVNDMKNGLKNDIKENLGKVKIIKLSFKEKTLRFLRRLFTKF